MQYSLYEIIFAFGIYKFHQFLTIISLLLCKSNKSLINVILITVSVSTCWVIQDTFALKYLDHSMVNVCTWRFSHFHQDYVLNAVVAFRFLPSLPRCWDAAPSSLPSKFSKIEGYLKLHRKNDVSIFLILGDTLLLKWITARMRLPIMRVNDILLIKRAGLCTVT